MNTTFDSSRHLRHTRLALLSTLFVVGITGCSLVLVWLVRYARWNMRSARICLLILNLIIANLSVYIFATGIQIGWELQNNRQWPFSDFLCRGVKFFQSCSILSSTYIIVVMAIDRCIAIVTPLRAGKIRVLYLCGSAWALACLLSTPNIFIFQLRVNGSRRYCTAVFNLQSTRTARRIYLTFISCVVYFLPFLVIVLCYSLIFIKLWWREQNQHGRLMNKRMSSCCVCFSHEKVTTKTDKWIHQKQIMKSSRSSFNDLDARRKRANTYAKARSKTFRMIIVLVLFMIVFGAPYYCLELYVAYTGRKPAELVLALAGGAAVAPSSIDPWIFLLFWVNWKQPMNSSRRLINLSLQQQQLIKQRGKIRAHTTGTSSSTDARRNKVVAVGTSKTPSYTVRWSSPRSQPIPV